MQVRGRGDAYYLGGVEPRAAELAAQPASFDPLATRCCERRTRRACGSTRGSTSTSSSSATELPAAREHVVYRHPDVADGAARLASELAAHRSRQSRVPRPLARWTRAQSTEIEGLYLSPISPEAVDYTTRSCAIIAQRYAVDGIHLDYVRFPTDDFDYSRATLAAFRAAIRGGSRRRRPAVRSTREEPLDLFVYTEALPGRWRGFRVAADDGALMTRLHATVKRERPAALVSVAVVPDAHEAAKHRLQDWRRWLDGGLVDVDLPDGLHHRTRHVSPSRSRRCARSPVHVRCGPASAAYRLSAKEPSTTSSPPVVSAPAASILFSYDSLTRPATGQDYLSHRRPRGLRPIGASACRLAVM